MNSLMGKPTCGDKYMTLQGIIDVLKYPETARPDKATKSTAYKEDFVKSLKDSGFDVDVSDPMLKYWYTPVDDIPDSEMPKEWDWRDVDGEDYTSPPRDQGNCGSCYIIGSLDTIESRVQIATKNKYKVLFPSPLF